MQLDDTAREALDCFLDNGSISEVLFEVKSGKEATVYRCRAPAPCPDGAMIRPGAAGESCRTPLDIQAQAARPHDSPHSADRVVAPVDAAGPLLAAKVYRSLESRRFKDDAIYLAGRMHMARNSRARRAALAHSDFGREVQYATWIDNEWELLHRLSRAGADVPEPVARGERAILLPFLGDESGAAPLLNDVALSRETASDVLARLLWNVELMLDCHVVHGDLSPFNILYHEGRATIIDLPQAIDPRLNPAACQLLSRDVDNICTWAKRRGVSFDAGAFVTTLWRRFTDGEVG